METTASAWTWSTRDAPPPLIVTGAAPEASTVTELSMVSWPDVSVSVPPARPATNVIVPSSAMRASASRSEPGPLSSRLVTTNSVGGGTGTRWTKSMRASPLAVPLGKAKP